MPKFKFTILEHKIVGHPYIPICKFQINDLKQNQSISSQWINPPLYNSAQLPGKTKKKQIFPINILLDCQQNSQFLIYLYELTSNGRQIKIGHTKITINESLINKKTKHRILKGIQKQVNKNNCETVSIMQIIITKSQFRSNSKEKSQIIQSGRLNQSIFNQSLVEEDSSQNSQKADSNQNYFQSTDQKNHIENSLQKRISNIKATLNNQVSRQNYQENYELDNSNYRKLIKNVDYEQPKGEQLLTESFISGYKKRRTDYKLHSIKKQAYSALEFANRNKYQSQKQQADYSLHKRVKYFKHIKNANLIKNIQFFVINQNQGYENYKLNKKNQVYSQSLTFLTYEFYEIIVKVLPQKNEIGIFSQEYSSVQVRLPQSNFVVRIQLMLEGQSVYSGSIGNQQGKQMKTILKLQNKNRVFQYKESIQMIFDIQKYVEPLKHKQKQSIVKEQFTKMQSQKLSPSRLKQQNQTQSQIRKSSFGPKSKTKKQQRELEKVALIQPWRFSQISQYNGQTIQNATSELRRLIRVNSQLNDYQRQQVHLPQIDKLKQIKFKKKSRKGIFTRRKLVRQQSQQQHKLIKQKQKLRNFNFSRNNSIQRRFNTESQDSNYYTCNKKLQKLKAQSSDLIEKMKLKSSKSKKKIKAKVSQNVKKSLQKPRRSHTQNQIESYSNPKQLRKTVNKKFIQQMIKLKRNQSKISSSGENQKIRKKQNQKILTLDVIQNSSLHTKFVLQIYSIRFVKQAQPYPAFLPDSDRQNSNLPQKQNPIFFKIYIQGKKSSQAVTSSSKKLKTGMPSKALSKKIIKKLPEQSYYQWYFEDNEILFEKVSKENFLILQAFYDLNVNDYQENIGKCIISMNQFMYLALKKQINGYLIHKSKVSGQLVIQFNLSLHNSEDSGRREYNNLNRWQY